MIGSRITMAGFFALAGIGGGLVAGATPVDAATACTVRGLAYTTQQDGVTYSTKVTKISKTGVTCALARDLAGKVAKRELEGRAIPRTISGLRVTVTRPCTGCAPVFTGKATSSGKRVTFTFRGGA